MNRSSYINFLTLPVFLATLNLFAQPYPSKGQINDSPSLNPRSDLTHLLSVSRDVFLAPTDFEANDWHNLIMTVSMTSLLFSVDPAIDKLACSNQSRFNDRIFGIDKYFGGKETLFLSMGVYGAGLVSGEYRLRRTGLLAFEAYIFSHALNKLLKLTFGRLRPYGSSDPMNFSPFKGGDLFSSLPSGHTMGAFSFAIVMSHAYESYWWKTLWYSSAALVAVSRIYNRQHWLSDTFLSFAISYSIAEFVVHYDEQQTDLKTSPPIMTALPLIERNALGITLSFRI